MELTEETFKKAHGYVKRGTATSEHAAKEFQKLRRLECADEHGITTCCTCGKRKNWKKVDGGHFHKRRHSGTLLHPWNVHPQCKGCNKWGNGRVAEYLPFMQLNYKPKQLKLLESLKKDGREYSLFELGMWKAYYLGRIEEEIARIDRGEPSRHDYKNPYTEGAKF